MKTLREILDSLSQSDRLLLDYAFEHDLSQMINLPDGRYIGVNLPNNNGRIQEQKSGVWSSGYIKKQ